MIDTEQSEHNVYAREEFTASFELKRFYKSIAAIVSENLEYIRCNFYYKSLICDLRNQFLYKNA